MFWLGENAPLADDRAEDADWSQDAARDCEATNEEGDGTVAYKKPVCCVLTGAVRRHFEDKQFCWGNTVYTSPKVESVGEMTKLWALFEICFLDAIDPHFFADFSAALLGVSASDGLELPSAIDRPCDVTVTAGSRQGLPRPGLHTRLPLAPDALRTATPVSIDGGGCFFLGGPGLAAGTVKTWTSFETKGREVKPERSSFVVLKLKVGVKR